MEIYGCSSQGRENIHEVQFRESKDEGSVQEVGSCWGEMMGVVIKPVLSYKRKGGVVMISYDRTVNSLLRRAILTEEIGGKA